MGKLGIDPKMVIRATCKKYIDTLPTDQAEAYVEEMRSAVGEAIQQKIDEAETWLTAAETSAQNAIDACTTLAVQAVCADPMAGVASAGVIASAKSGAATAKATVATGNAAVQQVIRIVGGFMLPLPAPVTAAAQLLNSADKALSALPL
jgi:hypothetical protein